MLRLRKRERLQPRDGIFPLYLNIFILERIVAALGHGLQPIVGNYFRNSAQDYTVLDFLSARSQRQIEAAEHIRKAIGAYDVQAIDTLIGDINPPAQLMQTQTERKIAEEQRKTYEVQEAAQKQRQQLVRQTSLADIQHQVVGAEQGVNIAELEANAHIKQATGDSEAVRLRAIGEAEAIRATGQAKAEAYRVGVESLGAQGYTIMTERMDASSRLRTVRPNGRRWICKRKTMRN